MYSDLKIVSIIVPTYNDWGTLKKCIIALDHQTYPKDYFEVIIINNNPNNLAPPDIILPGNFKMITEAKPGSYAARNTGLKIAKGEIIGFTDSDCVPDENWIKNAVEYLNKDKTITRVAGKIQILTKSTKPTTVELYNQLWGFPQKGLIHKFGGSVTANLFVYKDVFDTVGGFDEKLMSMGDKYWGMKAQNAGFAISYVEDVIVFHPPRTLSELIKKEKRHGGVIEEPPASNKLQLYLRFVSKFWLKRSDIRFMLGKHSRSKYLPLKHRVAIAFLRHYLLLVRAYESLKVQLGKEPNRE